MNLNSRLIFLFILCCLATGGISSYAQSINQDSMAKERQRMDILRRAEQAKRDSINRLRQEQNMARQDSMRKALDSMRYVRLRRSDSLQRIRERRADSLAAIREYKESKYYKDSVKWAREDKIRIQQEKRKRFSDSMAAIRKRITDSATASRKARIDSVKLVQKKKSDSLAAIRKYKESKRFADSVAVVKKLKTDSLTKVRKFRADSLAKARKKTTDSLAKVRKVKTDSLAKVRKVRTDSLTTVRKGKTDSLAKVQVKKEKAKKAKEKEREEKQQLAFELKIKKKHQAYSNEKMLKKRWGFPRSVVQNVTTRYNYFFNADRKMDEALQNMLRARKDNYDSLLALYPFNPDKDSALLSADMDSIIQKTSLGIQIHDPRTKWGDDLYILLGQAYFYKGNYNQAAASFRYALSLRDKRKKKDFTERNEKTQLSIAQADKKTMLDFLKHRSVHNEALLWLAHTFTQMHQEGNAESVLDLVDSDPNFPEDMKGRLALEKAFIYLHTNDQKAAAEQLAIVAEDNNIPEWLRMRAGYLTGQIWMNRGEYTASAKSFEKVLDLNPKIDMDFYTRKNLAYSMMYAGGNPEDATVALKKVLNDGKYAPYYEQVYYVIGRLSANAGKYDEAIDYLNKGLRSSKTTAKQKALSFATLGGIYYKQSRYTESQLAYDSAAALAVMMPKDTLMELAVKRSAALKGVTRPVKDIREQDSLLALAKLSQKDQVAAVRRYIRKLEQQRTDSIYKAENAGLTAQVQSATKVNNSNSPYANFYFSNAALVQSGINEFKRKWGNRPLVDNWRRGSAISSFVSNNQGGNDSDVDDNGVELDANGLPTEESLLAMIPNTEESKAESMALIQKSYIDLANAYIKELEDYPPGVRALDTFQKRFPVSEYTEEVLYLYYLAHIRQNHIGDAQVYAKQLLEKYPNSDYAKLVKPSDAESNVNVNANIAEYYDTTYNMLMNREYSPALARAQTAKTLFTDMNYRKRFIMIEGFAFAGIDSFVIADSIAREFIAAYPVDSLRPWADALLKFIQKNKPAAPAASAAASPASAAAASPASSPGAAAAAAFAALDTAAQISSPSGAPPPLPGGVSASGVDTKVPYEYEPAMPHFMIFSFTTMESRVAAIRSAFDDFNKTKFASLKLTAEIVVMKPDDGIIVVKAFANSNEARVYMNALRATTQIFREFKGTEYRLVTISADNFRALQTNMNTRAYIDFFNSNYK